MKNNPESPSGKYWKEHILSWEAGAYFKDPESRPSVWDKISTFFRGDGMYVRMEAALNLLKPYIQGKTIVDVGCASGRFALELLQAGAKNVTGIDVSPESIELANQKKRSSTHKNRLTFKVQDVTLATSKLPSSNIVTTLGVIEYFDQDELGVFMQNLNADYFFFDFPDSAGRTRNPLLWYLRKIYLTLNRCPGVYLYSQSEFIKIAKKQKYKNVQFYRKGAFDFVTNLPIKITKK